MESSPLGESQQISPLHIWVVPISRTFAQRYLPLPTGSAPFHRHHNLHQYSHRPTLNTPTVHIHSHAPSCIREELWNSDTGELICNVSVMYGKSHSAFDEADYVSIPPCLWGKGKQDSLIH